MKSRKPNALVIAVFIALVCIAKGTVVGWVYGVYEAHSIAGSVRPRSPQDPLDGLPIIGMGITFTGMVIGL